MRTVSYTLTDADVLAMETLRARQLAVLATS